MPNLFKSFIIVLGVIPPLFPAATSIISFADFAKSSISGTVSTSTFSLVLIISFNNFNVSALFVTTEISAPMFV